MSRRGNTFAVEFLHELAMRRLDQMHTAKTAKLRAFLLAQASVLFSVAEELAGGAR